LVRIPSVSGAEAEAAAFAADTLRRHGLDVERIGDNVVARREGGSGPTLMLNSHLDTVGAGPSWSGDPWAAEWRGGRLTGLGANDAKGCVAAMTAAMVSAAAGPTPAGTLALALTVGEETSNRGMEEVLTACGAPDAAVTGEPTGLEVVRSQAGLAVLEAEWRGKSCHAAHAARVPHRNALLEAVHDLATFPSAVSLETGHELLGPTTLVAAALHAGERHNRVPDQAKALFDARVTPPHDGTFCVAALERKLPGATVSLRSDRLRAVDTPAAHPLVRAALAAAGRRRAVGSSTLSDMALLHAVPAVKCGPGDSRRSHTPDEYLLLDELEAGAAFYAALAPLALEALAASPA